MYTQLCVQVQSSGPLNAFCKGQKMGQYNNYVFKINYPCKLILIFACPAAFWCLFCFYMYLHTVGDMLYRYIIKKTLTFLASLNLFRNACVFRSMTTPLTCGVLDACWLVWWEWHVTNVFPLVTVLEITVVNGHFPTKFRIMSSQFCIMIGHDVWTFHQHILTSSLEVDPHCLIDYLIMAQNCDGCGCQCD